MSYNYKMQLKAALNAACWLLSTHSWRHLTRCSPLSFSTAG